VEPGTHDASRRTYLAEERTLLAWWRSGLAAFAVSCPPRVVPIEDPRTDLAGEG
jgi:hypothetical protein